MKHLPLQSDRDLYLQRTERLKKLIIAEAPSPIVYFAAQTLLRTPYGNRFWRWIFSLIKAHLVDEVYLFKMAFGVSWLQLQGWPHSCAEYIYCGDPAIYHDKKDCQVCKLPYSNC